MVSADGVCDVGFEQGMEAQEWWKEVLDPERTKWQRKTQMRRFLSAYATLWV